jgi:hypothetical protein
MISVTAPQLIMIGALLIICSFVLPGSSKKLGTIARKIVYALLRVMRLVGFAALIAATIILLFPVFGPSDLTGKTLKELNETIEQYHHWLELSWTVLLVLIASLLVCFWFGWSELTAAQARLAGRVIKATSTPKILLGFLACCTFVGAGIEGRIRENTSKTEAAAQKLAGLQLQLFAHIEHEIEWELIEEIVKQASAQSPQFQQTVAAFNVVSPFMPNRPDRVWATDDKTLKDVFQKHFIPDIPLAQVEKVEGELKDEAKKESTPEDAFVDDFVHLAYDKGVSDSMKLYLRHIGNPLISELVANFLDPVFGEQTERYIAAQANQVMQNHFDRQISRAQLRSATQSLRNSIADKLLAVPQPMQAENDRLGDVKWDDVRRVLRRAIIVGLPGKKRTVQDDARGMLNRFNRMWSALNVVFNGVQERRAQPEKVFAAYLKQNADFAAIWGYAVISFTPNDYQSDLVDVAQRIGPPDNILESLENLVSMSEKGDAEAKKLMRKVDPENKLTFLSSPVDYARVWYTYHGPYPLHGYVLYENKIGDLSSEEAIKYYKSQQVTNFVNIYCPNNKATSAH